MPSPKPNIIKNLRAKHEPHQKLATRVDALEKEIRGISSIHKTLSKSFGMQRKTLMRVLALEKKVAKLKSETSVEEDSGDWADESGEWSSSGEASSTAEEGGETTTQTPTATATKVSADKFKKDTALDEGKDSDSELGVKKTKITGASLKKGTSQEPPQWFLELEAKQQEKQKAKKEKEERDARNARQEEINAKQRKTTQYKETTTGRDAVTGENLSAAERKARFKKRKITGADIKKGSSVEGAENVASEQSAMQKAAIEKAKIDIGTKYEGSPADGVTPTDAEAEKGGALAKGTESLIGPLKTIDNGVNSIVETLKQSNKEDADSRADARKAAEKAARDQKEGKLEGVKGKLATAAQTVLKPVQNIFERIWHFLKTVLLGRVVMQLFEWFTDPENSKKVASLFRFLKDWWPVIVAGIMAVVGPGIIFTAGLIALLMWGIPKIIEAVKWVGSLFGIGVDKELKTVEGEADKFGKQTSKDVEKEGAALSGDTKEEGGDDTSPDTQNEQTPAELGDTQKASEDVQSGADKMSEPAAQMAGGGEVPGTGNRDTVPAMLTPGEFVMSKGAVQQYGTDTLAGMNAAAGGTNRPTMGGYRSGGIVNNMSKNSVQNVKGGPRIHYNGGGQIIKPRIPVQYLNNGGKVMNLPPLGGGGGGTNSLTEQAKTKTLGTWIGDGIQGLFGITPKRMRDTNTGMDDLSAKIAKRSPKSASINPPSTPTTEVIVDQGVASQVQAAGNSMPDMDLPYFSASAMISQSKIRTLGIVV